MHLACLPFLVSAVSWLSLSFSRENNRLFYYETFSNLSVTTRAKRSSPSNGTLVKELRFLAFGREFLLLLQSGSSVLAEGFRSRMIHGDGTSTWFRLDQSKLFTGHVIHSQWSMVSAYLEGTLWNIHILEPMEAYAVEPAWRLLGRADNLENHTMVTYRLSDVKGLPHKYRFCAVPPNLNTSGPRRKHGSSSRVVYKGKTAPQRLKRSFKDTCVMNIVGDASLFENRCERNYLLCSSFMVSTVQMADELYRNSKFESDLGSSYKGIGLQVGELTIYTDYSNRAQSNVKHKFNEDYPFQAIEKLSLFSQSIIMDKPQYCLHHLFSDFRDPYGALGRAYTNSLCGGRFKRRSALNSGVSSGTNTAGMLVPNLVFNIVFVHEVGHNFGSNHDPDTAECGPKDEEGGKFIMWPIAVNGDSPNNHHFSKCSLRQIGRNIPGRCFKDRSKLVGFCGNGIVDAGEECDAGLIGLNEMDKCCSKTCHLRPSAICSETNEECCVGCQIAAAGTVCRVPGYLYTCIQESYCPGGSAVCLQGKRVPDGETCGDQHVCSSGECIGPCKIATKNSTEGKIFLPCSCSRHVSESCHYCCFDATNMSSPGECRPIVSQRKPDGSPCYMGLCEGGVCHAQVSASMIRLEKYIQFAQTSTLRKFMRANIVLIVVVLSLMVWLPASLYVAHLDHKEMLEREAALEEVSLKAGLEDLRNRYKAKAQLLSATRLLEFLEQEVESHSKHSVHRSNGVHPKASIDSLKTETYSNSVFAVPSKSISLSNPSASVSLNILETSVSLSNVTRSRSDVIDL
ncbi:hypothetical protein RRG08_067158 [Elysia crispata]|uniref:Uncharacterized protein n=1 Tax=Elysia crispata TaxID=231223 RepID=A0AAE0ZME4_9GAST|nr:hypothetical protein RRG08_067158 [Elysia crispata]